MAGVKCCRYSWLSVIAVLSWGVATYGQDGPGKIGAFEAHGDVGTVLRAGGAEFDAGSGTYTVSGSGENIWLGSDAFHFVWKKITADTRKGNLQLSADIAFAGSGGNAHRKAVLMMRQSLDPDSVYADVALHGNGLASLQFRDEKGGTTREVQSLRSAPRRLRIEKHGPFFTIWLGNADGHLELSAATPRIELKEPFYVGIGVCSHDKDRIESAKFSHVELSSEATDDRETTASFLETIVVASGARTAIHMRGDGRFEAPNWTRDGKFLIFNEGGKLYREPVEGGKPELLDTGFADRCNNDHGISPDSTLLAISDGSQEDHQSRVYVVPYAGGTPRRLTAKAPSYWHGWSPDGKTLAFVGQRDGNFDIYTIPVSGGEETRLTTAPGLDDGPEYSPDGKYIYFNSERTGHMQIWRMRADGGEQEQLFSDEQNNWFPHISPDGRSMVFLTYDKTVSGHPENKDVMLRLMTLSDKKITVLAKLFGGQGTMNVPSWSPNGTKLAFVSYTLLGPWSRP